MANYYMATGPLPAFVLPGDNDWFDCRPQSFPLLDNYQGYHVSTLEERGLMYKSSNLAAAAAAAAAALDSALKRLTNDKMCAVFRPKFS